MAEEDELRARLTRLEGEVADLSARLAALERASLPPAAPPSAPPGGSAAAGGEGGVAGRVPPSPAPRELPPGGADRGSRDWERLIAGRWALWLGALAIFLAVAFFLAYAWQLLGPASRLAGGFGLGAALMAAAWWVRRRAEPWFAEGLAGAGLGLFYLNVWSAYKTHGLLGTRPAFAALLGVTALGAFLAVRYGAPSQIALATAGGFLAPLVIGEAGGRDLGLPVYALILDAGLLAISLFRRWPGLAWACLAGTLVHWIAADVAGTPWPAFAVLTATFALFAGTSVGYSLRRGEATAPHDVLLLLAAAFVYAPAGYALIDAELGAWRPAFPLALAAACGGVGLLARRLVPANATFRMGADALAVFFVTLALPTWLAQDRLAIAWIVEAALLSALGLRLDDVVFRRLGRAVGVGAAIATAWYCLGATPEGAWPLLNARSLPLATAAVAAGAVALYAARHGRMARGAVLALVLAAPAWVAAEADVVAAQAAFAAIPDDATPRLAAGTLALLAAGYHLAARAAGAPAARVGAVALWAVAAMWQVFTDFAGAAGALADWRPLGTALVLAGGLAIASSARRVAAPGPREAALTGWLALALVPVAVWGLSVEAQGAVRAIGQAGWERQAQLAISLVWILSGVACLVAGIRAQARPFRLLGLGLVGASAVKVFAFDLAYLDTPYRIAAFACLGVALIGISWLYGRYGTTPPPAGERSEAQPPGEG